MSLQSLSAPLSKAIKDACDKGGYILESFEYKQNCHDAEPEDKPAPGFILKAMDYSGRELHFCYLEEDIAPLQLKGNAEQILKRFISDFNTDIAFFKLTNKLDIVHSSRYLYFKLSYHLWKDKIFAMVIPEPGYDNFTRLNGDPNTYFIKKEPMDHVVTYESPEKLSDIWNSEKAQFNTPALKVFLQKLFKNLSINFNLGQALSKEKFEDVNAKPLLTRDMIFLQAPRQVSDALEVSSTTKAVVRPLPLIPAANMRRPLPPIPIVKPVKSALPPTPEAKPVLIFKPTKKY